MVRAAGFQMRMRMWMGLMLLILVSGAAVCQAPAAASDAAATPGAPQSFEAADVHVSPYSAIPFLRPGMIASERFVMRNATMVDLIAAAYGVDAPHVYGGPPWLEWDHYDVIAKVPAGTTQATAKLMLQSLLADRFKLVAHPDTKPLPAYALTVGKVKPKLKETSGTGQDGCQYQPPTQKPTPGVSPDLAFSCHNVTMESFAQQLKYWSFGYITDMAVLDSTGLQGSWDFDLHWTQKQNLSKEGADGTSIFDAIDKQLGLKLGQTTAPQPVLTVQSVNEKPTDNVADLDKLMPPLPPAEFEVAIIKPSGPDEKQNFRINGGQMNLTGLTLDMVLPFAWQVTPQMVVGAPKSMSEAHYDILAKAPHLVAPVGIGQNTPPISIDDLQHMLQVLITERFNMKSHMEDRPMDAYTLVAVSPKLTKADPANRTGCKEGPGADGKDPRNTNPVLGRLVTCRNITMAQFAEQLRTQAPGYVHSPVLDATGIQGNYDLTLSFSGAGQLQGGGAAGAPAAGSSDSASDPSGGVSLFDAISRQLGLKMEKVKRPVPVLVIDHIDDKPTDN